MTQKIINGVAILALVIALGVAILGGGQGAQGETGPQGPEGQAGKTGRIGLTGPRGLSNVANSGGVSNLNQLSAELAKLESLLKATPAVDVFGGVTNYDELAAGDAAMKWEKLELKSGEITDSYTNRTGHTEFIDFAQVTTSGTASSSFDYKLYASSSASVATQHNFTDLVISAGLNLLSGTLATSSGATTTSSYTFGLDIMASSDGVVAILAGKSVLFTLQKGDFDCIDVDIQDGGCENASSTVRGPNLTALFRIHATSTTNN